VAEGPQKGSGVDENGVLREVLQKRFEVVPVIASYAFGTFSPAT
jgi:hypothetical protein